MSGCDKLCMSCSAESMKIAYSSGDSGHPCATPRCTAKVGDRAVPTRTLLDADEYISTRMVMRSTSTRSGPIYLLRPFRHLSRTSTVRKGTHIDGGETGLSQTGTLFQVDVPFEFAFVPQHVPFACSTAKVLVAHPRGGFSIPSMDPFVGPVVEQEVPLHQRARKHASHTFAALLDT